MLVGVLIYSMRKIRQMVSHYLFLSTRSDLTTFMVLCFITFAINWTFIIPVQAYY